MTEEEATLRLDESPLKKLQESLNKCRCDECNYRRDTGLPPIEHDLSKIFK